MQVDQLSTTSGQLMEGPMLITPQVFGDERGFFFESWNQRRFDQAVGQARVPSSGVIPPAPPPRRSRGGPLSSSDRLHGWSCKGWAGPFPWFEYHLNQTNHAQAPLCRT